MYLIRFSTLLHLILWKIIFIRAQGKMDSYMSTIQCLNYRPEIFNNLNCYVNRTSQSTGTFSLEFSLTEDINETTGNFKFSIKRGSSIAEYFSIKLDYCKIFENVQSNYFLKVFTTEVRRFSNFPLECSFKMNTLYYIRDFSLDTRLLPSYVPSMDFISETQINHKKNKGVLVILHGSLVGH